MERGGLSGLFAVTSLDNRNQLQVCFIVHVIVGVYSVNKFAVNLVAVSEWMDVSLKQASPALGWSDSQVWLVKRMNDCTKQTLSTGNTELHSYLKLLVREPSLVRSMYNQLDDHSCLKITPPPNDLNVLLSPTV